MGNFVALAFVCFGLGAYVSAEELSLEKIYLGDTFGVKNPSALYFVPDGKGILMDGNDAKGNRELSLSHIDTQAKTLVATANDLKLSPSDAAAVPFSHILVPSHQRFLILAETQRSRGTKTGGRIFLYTPASHKTEELASGFADKQVAQLSPDGWKLGFVSQNDLYVLDLRNQKTSRLTHTGSDTLLNGVFDWAYEEEFGILNAWSWSPDSASIAFWQLDQSKVPPYPLLNYKDAHPTIHWMHYPKAGDPNSTVRLGLVSVGDASLRWLDTGVAEEHYVPRMRWLNQDSLIVQVLNRDQNTLRVMKFAASDQKREILFTEKQATWVDVHDNLIPVPGSEAFLWTSEESGFNHIYLIERSGLRRPLTQGNWEVLEVVGTDGKFVFFLGNRERTEETQLYSVDLTTKAVARLSQGAGSHSAQWSPDFRYYLDSFSDSRSPRQLRLHNRTGALVRNFSRVPDALKNLKLAPTEFFEMKTSTGTRLFGKMIKPVDFDPARKYPVLLSVYGGPGSRKVVNGWDGLWPQFIARKGIVTVTVDNRGTGGRGKAFKSQTYLDLGKKESDDQIEVARYLQGLPWVDANHIGMWGWSYGGYLTALTVERGGSLFATGVAVAPVSNWKYYDSIYTERFMSTPAKNAAGYERSSPITHAASLTAPLLVVHGTGDDNVHYQNSLGLVDELLAHNKKVDTMIYPYRTHGLSEGQYVPLHVYRRITEHLLRYLKGEILWNAPNPLDELYIPDGFKG